MSRRSFEEHRGGLRSTLCTAVAPESLSVNALHIRIGSQVTYWMQVVFKIKYSLSTDSDEQLVRWRDLLRPGAAFRRSRSTFGTSTIALEMHLSQNARLTVTEGFVCKGACEGCITGECRDSNSPTLLSSHPCILQLSHSGLLSVRILGRRSMVAHGRKFLSFRIVYRKLHTVRDPGNSLP